MRIVFVGGVHGVGKSSCCERVSRALGVPYRSASSIIKDRSESAVASNSKEVADVSANQQLLIDGISSIVNSGVKRFLLDGHFYVPSISGFNEPVALTYFEALNIDGIALYEDDPDLIHQRRLERDGRAPTAHEIADLQALEKSRALEIARKLKVEIRLLGFGDEHGLADMIRHLWLCRV